MYVTCVEVLQYLHLSGSRRVDYELQQLLLEVWQRFANDLTLLFCSADYSNKIPARACSILLKSNVITPLSFLNHHSTDTIMICQLLSSGNHTYYYTPTLASRPSPSSLSYAFLKYLCIYFA